MGLEGLGPTPEEMGIDPETDGIEGLGGENDDTAGAEEDPLLASVHIPASRPMTPGGIASMSGEGTSQPVEEEEPAQETNNTDSEYEAMDDGGNEKSETLGNSDGTIGSK